ncbi:DUF2815 domain-containing protein [Bradyrhizobium sp. 83012]|uniref:DUF2815 domain-containing protein n=1 Tax=Bradyrhizobium aeschynomenes TaxID=2734909 RepID=A0ABX2CA12_9BRAD|nr:DUF2815 domain-containing protein [Bradyrhizobium aeschynomenes]NPU64618.1 DUF2815 domain-containing protein [Bradyrhizobium aeschynomenes]
MASTKRPTSPKGTSFKGIFKFPKLNDPDYGTKEYPKENGEFSTKLVGRIDDPDVQAFIAKWQPMHDEAIKRAEAEFKALPVATRKKLEKVTVNPLYTEIYDEETEEPTGEIEIKFAMQYSGVYKSGPKQGQKWTRRPAIFDAVSKQPMKKVPQIWGGTVGRIAFEVGLNKEGQPGYFIPATGAAGLTLRLQAARIIDLVSAGQRDASGYGFGDEEEGGYAYDPSSESEDGGKAEDGEQSSGGSGEAGDDNPDF